MTPVTCVTLTLYVVPVNFRCTRVVTAEMRRGGVRPLQPLHPLHPLHPWHPLHPLHPLHPSLASGDVLLFDQFTYHRGLPNLSLNVTRWSVDFRFQVKRSQRSQRS